DGHQCSQLAALRLALALTSLPAGYIDLDAAPAERAPEERLDQPYGLHTARADDLSRQGDEAAAEMQAVRPFRDGQPVLLVEPAPDEGRQADRRDEADPSEGRGRGGRRDGEAGDQPRQDHDEPPVLEHDRDS